jgi:hypothetical protein
MTTYTPDVWVVLEISSDDTEPVRKVLAGWYGGYANGDSWKLSSGVTNTTEYPDRYEFLNASGSLYICYKGCQRLTGLTGSVLAGWRERMTDQSIKAEIVHFPDADK